MKPYGSGCLRRSLPGCCSRLLHAFASIHLSANQVISGTAINMIAGSLTVFLARNITGSGNIRNYGVSQPFQCACAIGNSDYRELAFTKTYWTTWLILLFVVALSACILKKQPFGLRLGLAERYPQAAEAAGINVKKMRYIGVLISGAFCRSWRCYSACDDCGEFTGTVAGLGFLSLAALIFGQWRPVRYSGCNVLLRFCQHGSECLAGYSGISACSRRSF